MDLKHETPKQAMGGHEPAAPVPVIPPGTVAYEKTDVNAKSILRVGTILALVSVAAAAAAFGYFRLLVVHEERDDPPPPPLARPAEGRLPPEPRLQTAPPAELAQVREADRLALGEGDDVAQRYGWVDQAGGVARIPIEDAMALYVDQASRAAAAPASPMASPKPSPAASPMTSPLPSPMPSPHGGDHR
jgi:hypothetical protein